MDPRHEREGAEGSREGAAVRAAPTQGGEGAAQRGEEGVERTARGTRRSARGDDDRPIETRRQAGLARRSPRPVADPPRAQATVRTHRARRGRLAVVGARGRGRGRHRGPHRARDRGAAQERRGSVEPEAEQARREGVWALGVSRPRRRARIPGGALALALALVLALVLVVPGRGGKRERWLGRTRGERRSRGSDRRAAVPHRAPRRRAVGGLGDGRGDPVGRSPPRRRRRRRRRTRVRPRGSGFGGTPRRWRRARSSRPPTRGGSPTGPGTAIRRARSHAARVLGEGDARARRARGVRARRDVRRAGRPRAHSRGAAGPARQVVRTARAAGGPKSSPRSNGGGGWFRRDESPGRDAPGGGADTIAGGARGALGEEGLGGDVRVDDRGRGVDPEATDRRA